MLNLIAMVFAAATVHATEKPACILAASDEIFRLLKIHEPAIANDKERNIQVAVKEIHSDEKAGISDYASCGYEKYLRDEGPITKQYVVRLDKNCHVIKGKEQIREAQNCPRSF